MKYSDFRKNIIKEQLLMRYWSFLINWGNLIESQTNLGYLYWLQVEISIVHVIYLKIQANPWRFTDFMGWFSSFLNKYKIANSLIWKSKNIINFPAISHSHQTLSTFRMWYYENKSASNKRINNIKRRRNTKNIVMFCYPYSWI